jgi:hypothetical protein
MSLYSSHFLSHFPLLLPYKSISSMFPSPYVNSSWYSSVGIVTGLWTKRRRTGTRFAVEIRSFSPLLNVQTGSEALPAFCLMCTGIFFPGRQTGPEMKLTTHLHLVPRLKTAGPITSFSPQMASRRCTQLIATII